MSKDPPRDENPAEEGRKEKKSPDRREFLRIAGLTLSGFALLSPILSRAKALADDIPVLCGGGNFDITCGTPPGMAEGDENCRDISTGLVDPDSRCGKIYNEVRQEDLSCGWTADGATHLADEDCGKPTGNTIGFCPDDNCGRTSTAPEFDPDGSCHKVHWSGPPLTYPDNTVR